MGNNRKMPADLGSQIIKGLRDYESYLGFFVLANGKYVGLANCNPILKQYS
jgi:hypothetical protein